MITIRRTHNVMPRRKNNYATVIDDVFVYFLKKLSSCSDSVWTLERKHGKIVLRYVLIDVLFYLN